MSSPAVPSAELGAGLIQSLLIKAQRAQLDDIGRRVGTPVLYLKAAWADPVLYGGRGERTGSDIDVLVRPDAFEAFAAELEKLRFKRYAHPSPSYERYFGHKEWSFEPPPGSLSVDLHRELTEPIWYELAAEAVITRAKAWPSVDGPILSLDAADQILYGAAHYANHFYDLDDKHLEDCHRLLARFAAEHPVDWALVWQRARQASMTLPVALFVDALLARGVSGEGALGDRSFALRLRRRLADQWIETAPRLGRKRARSRGFDYLVLHPLLSDRLTALPRVVGRFGLPWVRDKLSAARRARVPKPPA